MGIYMKYQIHQPVYPKTTGCGGPADCATKDILHSSKVQNQMGNMNGGSAEYGKAIPNVVGASSEQNELFAKVAKLSIDQQENSQYDHETGMAPIKGGKRIRKTRRKSMKKRKIKTNLRKGEGCGDEPSTGGGYQKCIDKCNKEFSDALHKAQDMGVSGDIVLGIHKKRQNCHNDCPTSVADIHGGKKSRKTKRRKSMKKRKRSKKKSSKQSKKRRGGRKSRAKSLSQPRSHAQSMGNNLD